MSSPAGKAASLPLELLPLILDTLSSWSSVSTLATLCLVSRSWHSWTLPHLWRRIWLRDSHRVRLVFSVLRNHPELCRLVKVLELRVYPLGLRAEELEDLEDSVACSLREMSELRELGWTRTGSLNDRLLPDIVRNKGKLRHLELMGSTRDWSATAPMLWQGVPGGDGSFPFPQLSSLSIILPDALAMRCIVEIASRRPLSSLLLLCQHSSVFLPVHAQLLAPHLERLERLVLVGCKRLDGPSLRTLVGAAERLKVLAIEGCAAFHPDIFPKLAPTLRHSLATLTLTLPRPALCAHTTFYQHLAGLVDGLDELKEFTLYAPGGLKGAGGGEDDDFDDVDETAGDQPVDGGDASLAPSSASLAPKLPLSFIRSLTTSRPGLTLLRIHGIVASTESLRLIAQACTGLRELVVQLESVAPAPSSQPDGSGSSSSSTAGRESGLSALLAPLTSSLRTLHILARAGAPFDLDEGDVARLAGRMRALRQVGFRNRVWEVQRDLGVAVDDDEVSSSADGVTLKRWDASEGRWPEVLLVVKA